MHSKRVENRAVSDCIETWFFATNRENRHAAAAERMISSALVVKVESSARAMDVKAELLFINNDLHHWSLRASLKQQIWLRHKNARRHKNIHTNKCQIIFGAHTKLCLQTRVKFYRRARAERTNLLIFPPSFLSVALCSPSSAYQPTQNLISFELWLVKKMLSFQAWVSSFSDQ
jgi:hypothetical protein